MSKAHAPAERDRLPWLADEPKPSVRRRNNREAAGWLVAAALVAGLAVFSIQERSRQEPVRQTAKRQSVTTEVPPKVRLLEPVQPQVQFRPAPQISPVPEREVPMPRPVPQRSAERPLRRAAKSASASQHAEQTATTAAAARVNLPPAAHGQPGASEKPLTVWPAWQSQGAAGRIVRIGAFGSRLQAKLGWRYMVRAYPAVAHLPATVVETRNSRGRAFYRFQIGTTSQAHSEVLCQRMEKIRLSCAVVGLAWKPKGVER